MIFKLNTKLIILWLLFYVTCMVSMKEFMKKTALKTYKNETDDKGLNTKMKRKTKNLMKDVKTAMMKKEALFISFHPTISIYEYYDTSYMNFQNWRYAKDNMKFMNYQGAMSDNHLKTIVETLSDCNGCKIKWLHFYGIISESQIIAITNAVQNNKSITQFIISTKSLYIDMKNYWTISCDALPVFSKVTHPTDEIKELHIASQDASNCGTNIPLFIKDSKLKNIEMLNMWHVTQLTVDEINEVMERYKENTNLVINRLQFYNLLLTKDKQNIIKKWIQYTEQKTNSNSELVLHADCHVKMNKSPKRISDNYAIIISPNLENYIHLSGNFKECNKIVWNALQELEQELKHERLAEKNPTFNEELQVKYIY